MESGDAPVICSSGALAVTAAAVVVVDLAQTQWAIAAGPVAAHPRSAGYALVALVLCACWAAAILLTSSRALAAAGGIVLGGALGNVAALVLWPAVDGVPDPLVAGGIAFSLGDVAIGVGLALVTVVAVRFASENRSRWREPVLGRRAG